MKLDQQDIAHRMRAASVRAAGEHPNDMRWFLFALGASMVAVIGIGFLFLQP